LEVRTTMATAKLTPKDFVEALKEWSILDVVEAVKAIEDEFGIKAAAPVAAAAAAGPAAGGDGAAAEEEQTEFTVNLTAVGESKINVIKAVRELTQLGLKEAKDLVDAAPKPVLENVSKADAEKAVARLREAGATAELK
jgi:large subunit ribosomal protein L7/L12